jgi:hypothetical protein
VVVIHPTPRPQVGLLESKVLVVDFGTTGDWRDSIAALSNSFREGSFAPTVAILQCVRIRQLQVARQLAPFVEACQKLKMGGWNAVWVVPHFNQPCADALSRLKQAVFGVHTSCPDGECFVEVHKPDGAITIGMSGPSL